MQKGINSCGTIALILLSSAITDVAFSQETPEPADDNAAQLREDHEAVNGTWQRKTRDRNGREMISTKVELDGISIVTVRDADGKLLHRHRSEYELLRTGKVRIFRYRNQQFTEGPRKGQTRAGPFEYLYRVEKNRFVEINGMLIGDEGPVSVLVWEKVPEEAGDKNA